MDDVTSWEVVKPDRARAAYARVMPKAKLTLALSGGGTRELRVPARVGAKLQGRSCPLAPGPLDAWMADLRRLEVRTCSEAGMTYLEHRDHSALELERKLGRLGFSPQVVSEVMGAFRERRYIDDRRFCASFITMKRAAGWGRVRIEAELRRRGADPARLVDGYPASVFDQEEDEQRAREALSRKRVPEKNPYPKLVRFLVARGFEYPLAKRLVSERLEGEAEPEGSAGL